MTTNSMSCDGFTEQLMAYLEHETDDTTRTAIERHSVTCAECGALLADLRKLRIDAANLPPMQPARDLWSGIAERIEAPVVSIGTRQVENAPAAVTQKTHRWMRVTSIAAGLVFAASVGYFARGVRVETPADVAPVADAGDTQATQVATIDSAQPASPAASFANDTGFQNRVNTTVATTLTAPRSVEIQAAERAALAMAADYDREIARLRGLMDQRRNQLDPSTVAVIEKNLAVIDTAIAESKKAIARDPASGFLMESLNQSLRSKVELMRTAALLPSRT